MLNSTPVEWLQTVIKNCMKNLHLTEIPNHVPLSDTNAQLHSIYENFTTAEQQYIHHLIQNQFKHNDALLILSYIINYLKVEGFEQDVADHVYNGDFDCFNQIMLETQLIFLNKVPPYNIMRKIHRKNISCLLANTGISFPYIPLKDRNNNKIVIITEQLLQNTNHAPTLMTLETAYALHKYFNYDIEIFTCASNRLLPTYLWSLTTGFYSYDHHHLQISYKDAVLNAIQYPLDASTLNDYREMITYIHDLNPLFVLNIGANSPIADLPHLFTTVVNFNTVTTAPISEADIFIRCTKLDNALENLYKQELSSHQQQIFIKQNFPAITNISNKSFTRKELNLPEDKFLICLVGNRLDTEVSPSFRQLICSILRLNSTIDFVVIGTVHELKEHFENTNYRDRIHYLGYCPDLLGIYRTLNLYLNPERIGGGWSSAIALRAGLPVVTLPNCDVAYNVSETFTVTNEEQMIETILQYASDKVFYNTKHQQALDFASQNEENKIIDFLSEMLTKVKEALPND